MAEVFGFHCVEENLFADNPKYTFPKNYYKMQNVLNVLGWFPVVGSLVGVARVGGTAVLWLGDEETHRQCHKKSFAVSGARGVLEGLSLGWAFVMPDIVASLTLRRRTLNRVIRKERQQKKQKKQKKKAASAKLKSLSKMSTYDCYAAAAAVGKL
jgi:hypothetical protein